MTSKPTKLPVAEILYIGHYKCRNCRSEFTLPNPALMYRYWARTQHTKHGPRRQQLTTREGVGFAGLRREIKHTPTIGLEACENCFKERHVLQGALDLDPEPVNPNKIIPTPLSEF